MSTSESRTDFGTSGFDPSSGIAVIRKGKSLFVGLSIIRVRSSTRSARAVAECLLKA